MKPHFYDYCLILDLEIHYSYVCMYVHQGWIKNSHKRVCAIAQFLPRPPGGISFLMVFLTSMYESLLGAYM